MVNSKVIIAGFVAIITSLRGFQIAQGCLLPGQLILHEPQASLRPGAMIEDRAKLAGHEQHQVPRRPHLLVSLEDAGLRVEKCRGIREIMALFTTGETKFARLQ